MSARSRVQGNGLGTQRPALSPGGSVRLTIAGHVSELLSSPVKWWGPVCENKIACGL